MSVEDVNLQVSLLAGTDVAAVRTVPASESFHDDNIGEAILQFRSQIFFSLSLGWKDRCPDLGDQGAVAPISPPCLSSKLTSFLPPSLCIS